MRNIFGNELSYWIYPDKKELTFIPPIDLNNLFKYAVPKVRKLVPKGWLTGTIQGIFESDKDPALALFSALWQVEEEQ